MQSWCRKKQRPNSSSLAGAALHSHAVCWEPQDSPARLSTTVTAAGGCPSEASCPKIPSKGKDQTVSKLYPCSSHETLFADLCTSRFSGFADPGHLAAGKATASHAGEHLSSPLPQPTTFATEGLCLFQGLQL